MSTCRVTALGQALYVVTVFSPSDPERLPSYFIGGDISVLSKETACSRSDGNGCRGWDLNPGHLGPWTRCHRSLRWSRALGSWDVEVIDSRPQ